MPSELAFITGSHLIPPLETGDRLTRGEFERRYEAMPHIKKAELIEGIVYLEERVRATHGRAMTILSGWLGQYIARTPGLGDYGSHSTLRLDWDNEFQPDLFLNLSTALGGLADSDSDGFVSCAPTLICEIASSEASVELHAKLHVYRRNQVSEYLVWRTQDREVNWFAWREGSYEKLAVSEQGVIKSERFPGLWLDTRALLDRNLPALFKTIDEGAASAEHAAFLTKLNSR